MGGAEGSALPQVGDLLAGRYRIERELDAGGMGSAYLSKDEGFRGGRRVVVKIPHASLLNAEFRERFDREIQELATLEHPRVIPVYDAGSHEDVPFLVVRYVAGGDLRARMPKGRPLDPRSILAWLPALAEGLDFVHRRGRLHRDVKPANVLFDADDNAYLSDFGIATVLSRVEESAPGAGDLTGTGGWVGSPAYAPPEAVVRELTPQYDQYSLALVVYEALTERFPFEATTGSELMTAKLYEEPVPLARREVSVAAPAAAAVMRALERDPRRRFESCTAFAEAFEAGLEGQSLHAVPGAPAHQEDETRPGRRALPSEVETVVQPGAAAPSRGGSRGASRGWLAAVALVALAGGAWLLRAPSIEPGPVPTAPAASPAPAAALPTPAVPASLAAPLSDEPMVVVPAGPFRYGCNDALDANCEAEEKPGRTLVLPRYWIDRTEVPVSEFRRCVEAGACDASALASSSACNYEARREDHPMNCLEWESARAFCAWRGHRLPTEAEWEKAARGREGALYPWGSELDDLARRANLEGEADGFARTARVESLPAGGSPYGALHMVGNVSEFVDRPGRVRGGSFDDEPASSVVSRRTGREEIAFSSRLGFRCARDAEAPAVARRDGPPPPPAALEEPAPRPEPPRRRPFSYDPDAEPPRNPQWREEPRPPGPFPPPFGAPGGPRPPPRPPR